MRRALLTGFAVLLVAVAAFAVPTIWFQPWSVNHFYARVFIGYMLRHPEILTSMGIANQVPFGGWRDRLDDYSPEGEEADLRFAEDNLARLRRYDPGRMKPEERLSFQVMDWFLTDAVRNAKFRQHDYPLNQLSGFQGNLPEFLLQQQPLATPRDAESYLRRVAAIPKAVDQTLARLERREERGVVPPRFVLRRVREEMTGFLSAPPAAHELVKHFAAKAESIPGLDAAKREKMRADLAKSVETGMYPAYRKLIAFVERQEGIATDDDGVWKLPDGDAFYDAALRTATTSDLPADTIHALGEREVAALQARMTPLLDRVGLPRGPFGERMARMRQDPRFGYPPGDSGRALILARYEEILEDASKRSEALFGVRPRGELEVRRIPPFKEATSPGAYYNAGAFDGSRPGVFYANLRDPAETRRPDMRTLAYHEGIPGHHFQITLAQELKGVAFFRKVIPFTAYGEGWALYAERVALEHGFHQDAYDSLGAMGAELFRAVRLVVDTGIHRRHWTRQQAIDYMVANTGMDTPGVVSEVERYIVMPGQACAYKVGQLEILALRQRARDRLGDRFDIREFHDVVLTHGALPLTLLDQVVEDWIRREETSTEARRRG